MNAATATPSAPKAAASKAQRPRVLVITFNRLVPSDQGNSKRIMQLVSLYKRLGYEMDLVYHQEEGFDPALSHALTRHFTRVMVLPSRSSKPILPGHICRLTDWYDRALTGAVRQLHQLRGYKVVHVNYCWYAPVFDVFGKDVVKVLDTHDVFANRSQKYILAGMKPQWFSTTIEDEDLALQAADAALAIQREEGAELAARGHHNILYLPYVEPALKTFDPPAPGKVLTYGYVGSGNDWNVKSMQEFLSCLQAKRQQGGFASQVLVAGGICKHLRDFEGVTRLGFINDLATFYSAIDIAINPMIGGTGLKIKTVEPLCFGRAVLATPSGAQGLDHLWKLPVLPNPQGMVDYIWDTLRHPEAGVVEGLFEQAKNSRANLDAEYNGQVERFQRFLQARIGA